MHTAIPSAGLARPRPFTVDVASSFLGLAADQRGWLARLSAKNLARQGALESAAPTCATSWATTTSRAITVQPWGAPAVVRLPPEKRWYLTNTSASDVADWSARGEAGVGRRRHSCDREG